MKLTNRGIIGSWRKGRQRTLVGFLQFIFTIGTLIFFAFILHQHAIGEVSFRQYRAVAIVSIGLLIASFADSEKIWYFIAWLADDEEIAY